MAAVAALCVALSMVPRAFADSAPGSVMDLQITAVAAGSVSISWSAPVLGGAPTGYVVQYKSGVQPSWSMYDNSSDPTATEATVPIGPGIASVGAPGVPRSVDGYAVQVSAVNDSGSGTASSLSSPTSVSVSGAACAALASSSVDCWGANGQFGDGTTIRSHTPVPVMGITNATSVGVGAASACAVLASGGVECWGANEFGGLGDGLTN